MTDGLRHRLIGAWDLGAVDGARVRRVLQGRVDSSGRSLDDVTATR